MTKAILGNSTADSSVDFFDNTFTFSNQTSTVTCCRANNVPVSVTCGLGTSCAGVCSALDASLCPTGNCTDDPSTCEIDLEDDKSEMDGGSPATSAGSDLKWCLPGCKVRKHKECCYNPNCLKKKGRKSACKWMNYLTGRNYQSSNQLYCR